MSIIGTVGEGNHRTADIAPGDIQLEPIVRFSDNPGTRESHALMAIFEDHSLSGALPAFNENAFNTLMRAGRTDIPRTLLTSLMNDPRYQVADAGVMYVRNDRLYLATKGHMSIFRNSGGRAQYEYVRDNAVSEIERHDTDRNFVILNSNARHYVSEDEMNAIFSDDTLSAQQIRDAILQTAIANGGDRDSLTVLVADFKEPQKPDAARPKGSPPVPNTGGSRPVHGGGQAGNPPGGTGQGPGGEPGQSPVPRPGEPAQPGTGTAGDERGVVRRNARRVADAARPRWEATVRWAERRHAGRRDPANNNGGRPWPADEHQWEVHPPQPGANYWPSLDMDQAPRAPQWLHATDRGLQWVRRTLGEKLEPVVEELRRREWLPPVQGSSPARDGGQAGQPGGRSARHAGSELAEAVRTRVRREISPGTPETRPRPQIEGGIQSIEHRMPSSSIIASVGQTDSRPDTITVDYPVHVESIVRSQEYPHGESNVLMGVFENDSEALPLFDERIMRAVTVRVDVRETLQEAIHDNPYLGADTRAAAIFVRNHRDEDGTDHNNIYFVTRGRGMQASIITGSAGHRAAIALNSNEPPLQRNPNDTNIVLYSRGVRQLIESINHNDSVEGRLIQISDRDSISIQQAREVLLREVREEAVRKGITGDLTILVADLREPRDYKWTGHSSNPDEAAHQVRRWREALPSAPGSSAIPSGTGSPGQGASDSDALPVGRDPEQRSSEILPPREERFPMVRPPRELVGGYPPTEAEEERIENAILFVNALDRNLNSSYEDARLYYRSVVAAIAIAVPDKQIRNEYLRLFVSNTYYNPFSSLHVERSSDGRWQIVSSDSDMEERSQDLLEYVIEEQRLFPPDQSRRLTEMLDTLISQPISRRLTFVANPPTEFIIDNPQDYLPDRQEAYLESYPGDRWTLWRPRREVVLRYAYIDPSPNAVPVEDPRFQSAEHVFDSEWIPLGAASALRPEEQARLIQLLAKNIIAIHRRHSPNMGLMLEWLDAQGGSDNEDSSYNGLLDLDDSAGYGVANGNEPEKRMLSRERDEPYERDELMRVWDRRLTALEEFFAQPENQDPLTLQLSEVQERQLDFLSRSIDMYKLIRAMRAQSDGGSGGGSGGGPDNGPGTAPSQQQAVAGVPSDELGRGGRLARPGRLGYERLRRSPERPQLRRDREDPVGGHRPNDEEWPRIEAALGFVNSLENVNSQNREREFERDVIAAVAIAVPDETRRNQYLELFMRRSYDVAFESHSVERTPDGSWQIVTQEEHFSLRYTDPDDDYDPLDDDVVPQYTPPASSRSEKRQGLLSYIIERQPLSRGELEYRRLTDVFGTVNCQPNSARKPFIPYPPTEFILDDPAAYIPERHKRYLDRVQGPNNSIYWQPRREAVPYAYLDSRVMPSVEDPRFQAAERAYSNNEFLALAAASAPTGAEALLCRDLALGILAVHRQRPDMGLMLEWLDAQRDIDRGISYNGLLALDYDHTNGDMYPERGLVSIDREHPYERDALVEKWNEWLSELEAHFAKPENRNPRTMQLSTTQALRLDFLSHSVNMQKLIRAIHDAQPDGGSGGGLTGGPGDGPVGVPQPPQPDQDELRRRVSLPEMGSGPDENVLPPRENQIPRPPP